MAVMDVIGFLYVSLDSSRVQLHDNLGSRRTCTCSKAGFSSQKGDRASTTEKQRFVLLFLCGEKDSMQRIFIKKCFLFTMGKGLSRKTVQKWVEKFCQGRSKVADDARSRTEVAKTTVKILLCCGFPSTGKAMGQVCQCLGEGVSRNVFFFPRFEYNMFYVLYPFVIYLLTLHIVSLLQRRGRFALMGETIPIHFENHKIHMTCGQNAQIFYNEAIHVMTTVV
jgi:hypothetical protein